MDTVNIYKLPQATYENKQNNYEVKTSRNQLLRNEHFSIFSK